MTTNDLINLDADTLTFTTRDHAKGIEAALRAGDTPLALFHASLIDDAIMDGAVIEWDGFEIAQDFFVSCGL